jgi:hypothetical protein
MSTGVNTRYLVVSVFLIFLVFCVVCFVLFVFVLCLVYPMYPVFSNISLHIRVGRFSRRLTTNFACTYGYRKVFFVKLFMILILHLQ